MKTVNLYDIQINAYQPKDLARLKEQGIEAQYHDGWMD